MMIAGFIHLGIAHPFICRACNARVWTWEGLRQHKCPRWGPSSSGHAANVTSARVPREIRSPVTAAEGPPAGRLNPRPEAPATCERPGWFALLERWQFDTNCLASVAIEVPALRPVLAARIAGADGGAEPSS